MRHKHSSLSKDIGKLDLRKGNLYQLIYSFSHVDSFVSLFKYNCLVKFEPTFEKDQDPHRWIIWGNG